jgi:hypothetical protein
MQFNTQKHLLFYKEHKLQAFDKQLTLIKTLSPTLISLLSAMMAMAVWNLARTWDTSTWITKIKGTVSPNCNDLTAGHVLMLLCNIRFCESKPSPLFFTALEVLLYSTYTPNVQ